MPSTKLSRVQLAIWPALAIFVAMALSTCSDRGDANEQDSAKAEEKLEALHRRVYSELSATLELLRPMGVEPFAKDTRFAKVTEQLRASYDNRIRSVGALGPALASEKDPKRRIDIRLQLKAFDDGNRDLHQRIADVAEPYLKERGKMLEVESRLRRFYVHLKVALKEKLQFSRWANEVGEHERSFKDAVVYWQEAYEGYLADGKWGKTSDRRKLAVGIAENIIERFRVIDSEYLPAYRAIEGIVTTRSSLEQRRGWSQRVLAKMKSDSLDANTLQSKLAPLWKTLDSMLIPRIENLKANIFDRSQENIRESQALQVDLSKHLSAVNALIVPKARELKVPMRG